MSDRTHGGASAVDDEDLEFPFTPARCPGHDEMGGAGVCCYCGTPKPSLDPFADARMGKSIFEMRQEDWYR